MCRNDPPAGAGDAEKAGALARGVFDALGAEYGALESDMTLRWERLQRAPEEALEPADAGKVLALLLTLPHGVLKYSHTVPGARTAARRCSAGALLKAQLPMSLRSCASVWPL